MTKIKTIYKIKENEIRQKSHLIWVGLFLNNVVVSSGQSAISPLSHSAD